MAKDIHDCLNISCKIIGECHRFYKGSAPPCAILAVDSQTPTNSDYAAALRVITEWEVMYHTGHPVETLRGFCKKRLNAEIPHSA